MELRGLDYKDHISQIYESAIVLGIIDFNDALLGGIQKYDLVCCFNPHILYPCLPS